MSTLLHINLLRFPDICIYLVHVLRVCNTLAVYCHRPVCLQWREFVKFVMNLLLQILSRIFLIFFGNIKLECGALKHGNIYLFSYTFISRMKSEIFVLEPFLPLMVADIHA